MTEAPNPIVKETPLRAYPGWTVRQYKNGMFDATDGYGLTLGVRTFQAAVKEVREQEALAEMYRGQQESEIAAENAWLRAAENAGWEDQLEEERRYGW